MLSSSGLNNHLKAKRAMLIRKRFFALLAFFASALLVFAQTTYTLAIGVGTYPASRGVKSLNMPPKDAETFSKLMKSQGSQCAIFTSRYATRDKVLSSLRAICQKAGTADRIFIYYSGHGGVGGICPYDANLAYDEIVPILTASRAQRIYIFIDACHSGSIGTSLSKASNWPGGQRTDKIVAFCASRDTENSAENALVPQGFFTQGLLKALRGKGDENGDKQLTVMEVFNFAHKELAYRSYATPNLKQHPVLLAPQSARGDVLVRY